MRSCRKCGKPVYFAERRQSMGFDWHRECLRCQECGKVLNPGQHAEHKETPYCHIPCYSALFGPKLFGHGSQVGSHQSFGKRKEAHVIERGNGLGKKVKTYNDYHAVLARASSQTAGPGGSSRLQLTAREVNGRLVLEGVLRVYWGVEHSIRIKEFDDKRPIAGAVSGSKDRPPSAPPSVLVLNDNFKSLSAWVGPKMPVAPTNGIADETDGLAAQEAIKDPVQKRHPGPMQTLKNARWRWSVHGNLITASLGGTRPELQTLSKPSPPPPSAPLPDLVPRNLPGTLRPSSSMMSVAHPTHIKKRWKSDESSQSVQEDTTIFAVVKKYPSQPDVAISALLPQPGISGCRLYRYGPLLNLAASSSTAFKSVESYDYEDDECEDAEGEDADIGEGRQDLHDEGDGGQKEDENHFDRSEDEDGSEAAKIVRGSGPRALRRRPGMKLRKRKAMLHRRSSFNGHWYDRDTSVFTPPKDSHMNVWTTSLVKTQEVIRMLLDKYRVESEQDSFSLFVVKDSGERQRILDNDFPLLIRVNLGPHEDAAKIYLMNNRTLEIRHEVAQFLRFSYAELRAILNMFYEEEENEMERIKQRYLRSKQSILKLLERR